MSPSLLASESTILNKSRLRPNLHKQQEFVDLSCFTCSFSNHPCPAKSFCWWPESPPEQKAVQHGGLQYTQQASETSLLCLHKSEGEIPPPSCSPPPRTLWHFIQEGQVGTGRDGKRCCRGRQRKSASVSKLSIWYGGDWTYEVQLDLMYVHMVVSAAEFNRA